MALNIEVGKETIEVVSSKDEAVGADKDGYAQYLENLDEAALNLKPGLEPTRFVMRKVLPFAMSQKIKTEQASLGEDGKIQVRMGYIMDEIRASLVDIKNPGGESLKFRKDSDGYASKEIISLLESAGIINELYAARQGAVRTSGAPKKS